MELGNMIFGHSRGEYQVNRKFVDLKEWNDLLEHYNLGFYGDYIETDKFIMRPYYWGEEEEEMDKPNFVYKPMNIEIRWYKYPFRDSYSNVELNKKLFKFILKDCLQK